MRRPAVAAGGAALRLGSFRPFIGAVFGLVIYFALESNLLQLDTPEGGRTFFFFALIAFVAGFSERLTKVTIGKAERSIAAALEGAGADEPAGKPTPPAGVRAAAKR